MSSSSGTGGPLGGGSGDAGAPLLSGPPLGPPSSSLTDRDESPRDESLGAVVVEVPPPSYDSSSPAATAATAAAAAAAATTTTTTAAAATAAAAAAAGGSPLESPLLGDTGGHIRSCFICLEGPQRGRRGNPPKLLFNCCTQCYAVVHEKCWAAFRRRQRLSSFRARLLGQRSPDTTRCAVCRTGRGGIPTDASVNVPPAAAAAADEGATDLQEQLLASLSRLLIDDDPTPSNSFCTGYCICCNSFIFILFLLLGGLLISIIKIKGINFFLFSLFFYYHFILFQLLFLAIKQRREALSLLPPAPQPPDSSPSPFNDQGGPSGSSPSLSSSSGAPPYSSRSQSRGGGPDPEGGGAQGMDMQREVGGPPAAFHRGGVPYDDPDDGGPQGDTQGAPEGAPQQGVGRQEEGTDVVPWQQWWSTYGVGWLSSLWRRGSGDRGPPGTGGEGGGGPAGPPSRRERGQRFMAGTEWDLEMQLLHLESLPA